MEEKLILNRFLLFFNILEITKYELSNLLNLKKQNINRLFDNYKCLTSHLFKLRELGCNLDWLYSGEGPIIIKNINGLKLIKTSNLINEDGNLISHIILNKIINWVISNYDSLESFATLTKNNEILEIKNKFEDYDYVISLDLFQLLQEYGCNIQWLFNSSNKIVTNQFANNLNGIKLKRNNILKEQFRNLKNIYQNNNNN